MMLRLNDLRQHSDILRLRSGKSLTVRFVEPDDADALQGYFRALSVRSRYSTRARPSPPHQSSTIVTVSFISGEAVYAPTQHAPTRPRDPLLERAYRAREALSR